MAFLRRFLTALPLLIFSPLVMAVSACALLASDLWWRLFGAQSGEPERLPRRDAASVVIPNWNGKDLLEKYLPSIEAALAGNGANEILVVDNGSSDGSVEMLRSRFPGVKTLALEKNLGFGGGSNAGFRAASNDVVVLLNSDMRVEPDFLAPLLAGFTDEKVFAVSCQIFFSDPERVREETGLTQGWWEDGSLRVRHRVDEGVTDLYPCFYGGGGSCAFDRRKFLELGGFDSLLAPFYLEDTDLGFMAWKRGWKVLYQPKSRVFHEHRGTIGKKFTERQIQAVLKKNFILFCWKNIHGWDRLLPHLFFTYAGALLSLLFGDEVGRANLAGLWRAFLSLPRALRSRCRARSLARVDDGEAFRRPLGGYFRDRFHAMEAMPERLSVLFVSPYPICPPTHGGGLFMYQTVCELARMADVHAIILLDRPDQLAANQELDELCASTEFLLRMEGRTRYLGSIVPHAVREFQNDDLAWRIHRQIYTRRVDVVQLEYTPLGQYAGGYNRIPSILFEHDVYFQSIGRGLEFMRGPLEKIAARFEYLRAIRWELRMLPRCDRVQVCTAENKAYLASFLPGIRPKLQAGLRAGIDTSRYRPPAGPREPETMLFLGSIRHGPNAVALEWFARKVIPRIREARPRARVVVIGADPPPRYAFEDLGDAVECAGFVEDIREALARYAVFVCPILSGSGVRVKLLEAFAAGIPAVSTYIGAEGLARKDGEFCLLADEPEQFAAKALWLFDNPEKGAEMAARARREVVENWDMAALTRRLEQSYREAIKEKRG
ncbi:MAG TPA: glycosyltransferase [Bryobacteraceae bacterium]|nr:glycosyltransferase [Bryobacteraceae bacterium]